MAVNRAVSGKYVGKDSTELSALRTQFETARTNCLTGHQSYSVGGRTINRVPLEVILQEITEVEYAQGVAGGTVKNTTYVDLSV